MIWGRTLLVLACTCGLLHESVVSSVPSSGGPASGRYRFGDYRDAYPNIKSIARKFKEEVERDMGNVHLETFKIVGYREIVNKADMIGIIVKTFNEPLTAEYIMMIVADAFSYEPMYLGVKSHMILPWIRELSEIIIG